MTAPRILRSAVAAVLALAGVTLLGACEEILAATTPDRHLDPHVDCSSGTCICTGGFGDCNGDVDDGCETELDAAPNCGACGATCANGSCESSACVCAPGFADCDGDVTNGCETSTIDDPDNCGGCNIRCGAGTCTASGCAAATLASVANATSIGIGGATLFVGACGGTGPSVTSFALPGASPTTVAPAGCAQAVAGSDDGEVAWATSTSILSNGPLSSLAIGEEPTALLAAVVDAVYFWDKGSKSLERVSSVDGTITVITTGAVTALGVDSSNVYWSDAQGLHAMPHQGDAGDAIVLNDAVMATAIAANGFDVYALDPGGVEIIDPAGGPASTLAGTAGALSMTADSGGVYWTMADGSIRKSPLGETTATVLVTGESFGSRVPMVTDSSSLYWIASDGSVRTIGH